MTHTHTYVDHLVLFGSQLGQIVRFTLCRSYLSLFVSCWNFFPVLFLNQTEVPAVKMPKNQLVGIGKNLQRSNSALAMEVTAGTGPIPYLRTIGECQEFPPWVCPKLLGAYLANVPCLGFVPWTYLQSTEVSPTTSIVGKKNAVTGWLIDFPPDSTLVSSVARVHLVGWLVG